MNETVTARAVVAHGYGETSLLRVEEVDVPAPGKGQVTIDVRAAGVNPSDLKQLRGEFGRTAGEVLLRPGAEVSGIVTAVGPVAEGPAGPVHVGDEVIGYRVSGGFSERITVNATSVLPKPTTLDWAQAAGLMLTGVTATHLIEATGVKAGDRVLIHGASGGVGQIAVQLAVLRGAEVIGTAGVSSGDRVRALGAQAVEYGPGLADRIRAIWPAGADVALDTVGTDEAIDVSLELVADPARIATIAAFRYAAGTAIKLLGGGPGADPGSAIRSAARLQLVQLAAEGKLDVAVSRSFTLDDTAQALDLVFSGRGGGKVVVVP